MNELRNDWNKRQIDNIEKDVKTILKIMNGNGETGLCAKVDLMWSYRILFIGAIVANLGSIVYFIIVKGG